MTLPGRTPIVVTLVTTGPECTLCEEAKDSLERLAGVLQFRLEEVDLRDRPESILDYALRAPVVLLDGRILAEGRIPPGALERALWAAGVPVRAAKGAHPG